MKIYDLEYDEEGYMFLPDPRPALSTDWQQYREDTTHEVIRKAKERGCDVLLPEDDELFIDIDTDEQYELMQERLRKFPNMMFMQARIVRDVPSASGLPHRHVTVKIGEPMPPEIRAAMQMFLCSDPVREILAIRRVLQGVENPIIFIEGGKWKEKV